MDPALPLSCSVILLCSIFALSLPAWAASSLESQRQKFLLAEQAQKRGDTGKLNALMGDLKTYPLYPYLEYENLKKNIHALSKSDLYDFMKRYPESDIADRLRTRWLESRAEKNSWSEFLAVYDGESSTAMRCYATQAKLIKSPHDSEARQAALKLWQYGKSQPKACDGLFERMAKLKMLTSEQRWRRVKLAMYAGQTKLAAYLGKKLTKPDQDLIKLWITLRANPKKLNDAATLKKLKGKKHAAITLHTLERLMNKDSDAGIHAFTEIQKLRLLNTQDLQEAKRGIALKLILRKDKRAKAWIRRINVNTDDKSFQAWRVRHALGEKDWKAVVLWIENMSSDLAKEPVWRYWYARALAELGHPSLAEKEYEYLSNMRHYYGFLAQLQLGRHLTVKDDPIQVHRNDLARMAERKNFQRASELLKLGRFKPARREWWAAVNALDQSDQRVAAKLASSWGWHDMAIRTAKKADHHDDITLRFPLAFKQGVMKYAKLQDIDPALVFSIARQESLFAQDARSRTGAMGLMQLMPRTARNVAKSLKLPYKTRSVLYQPDFNLQLGTSYISQLLETMNGNTILATASYNAGPHRIKGWLFDGEMPADLWIETVPFYETRDYLKNVLAYSVVYDARLGRKSKLNDRMPTISALHDFQ